MPSKISSISVIRSRRSAVSRLVLRQPPAFRASFEPSHSSRPAEAPATIMLSPPVKGAAIRPPTRITVSAPNRTPLLVRSCACCCLFSRFSGSSLLHAASSRPRSRAKSSSSSSDSDVRTARRNIEGIILSPDAPPGASASREALQSSEGTDQPIWPSSPLRRECYPYPLTLAIRSTGYGN